jgi:CheY-like chemotaxis protein
MTKILVIEDEESVRLNLVEMLEAEDYEAVSAPNGMIGAMGALDHIPDLVICDVMMPELDGYGVLETLRQDPTTATIPFIFLTAKADKGDMREGMELGADDYLTKPFTRDELLQSITARLKKQAVITQQHTASAPSQADQGLTTQKQDALQPSPGELQHQVQELQRFANLQEELLKKSHQEMSNFLAKINMAIFMLKNTASESQRDRCLEILQEACTEEIAMLNQVPNLQDWLTPENITLLHQLNLVNTDRQVSRAEGRG